MHISRLDLAQEERLRSWARINYVPAAQRVASWHPIVLAEMQSLDAQAPELPSSEFAGARYVPLAPNLPGHFSPTNETISE